MTDDMIMTVLRELAMSWASLASEMTSVVGYLA